MSAHAESSRLRATPVLAVGVLAIGFAAPLIRLAAPTPPLVLAGLRLAIAAGLLLPFTLRAIRSRRLDARALRLGALGGLAYALHFGAWVRSLELTSVAASVTIVTSTPLMLAIVALITGRDRPTRRHWLAIALGVLGLSVLSAHGLDAGAGTDELWGDTLAFLGAVAVVFYLLLVRRLGPNLPTMAFLGVPCGVGATALLGAAYVTHLPIEAASPRALMFITLAALVPQLIGHGALTYSLGSLRPTVVGMATVGEPVVATLLAFLFLGEGLDALTAIGCAITLGGVLLALSPNQPAKSDKPVRKRSKIP
ncbi:MAG: DMT family transporter [Deltaproteobacteria bacterium]|nr:DMT family transporter [Deltaproteobacteria bacterium]